MRRIRLLLLIMLIAALTVNVSTAQDTPTPTTVQVRASDGITLYGDYYEPANAGDAPAVLLLHQMYTTRTSWSRRVAPLLAEGYRVLVVDLRGYGQSRGRINWTRAQTDTQTWLNWLYEQPGIRRNAVFVMGSSMGANLALVGCAQAEHCAGAVALSPGRNYFGVHTDAAILSGRAFLIIYAEQDNYPARDVPRMLQRAEENELNTLTIQAYPGRAHGMELFPANPDLMATIIGWMYSRR